MCGFVGYIVEEKNELYGNSLLQGMKKRIEHRGPDDDGSYFWNEENECAVLSQNLNDTKELPYLKNENLTFSPHLALGHQRLSIQDLSHFGHQPLSDDQGNYWIVYNGEIFNYMELKVDLEKLGYTFYSNTDTEVLLKGYKEYGIEILNKIDGFYSFVLFDKEKQKVIATRDNTGVKPLYYTCHNGVFAFASEIKAFFELPRFNAEPEDEVIQNFLIHEKIEIDKKTFYKNVYQLMPGELLTYDLKAFSYSIDPFVFTVNTSGIELKQQIIDSVKSRLLSDVPIGFALSGGIDSTLISSIANTKLAGKINLFSANSNNPVYDESKWQEMANHKIQGNWFKTYVDTDLIDFEKLNYIQDGPIMAANNIANYQLYKTVKSKGIKVLLNGQGADELFGGYPIYFAHYYLSVNRNKKKELLNSIKNSPISLSDLKKDILKLRFQKWLPNSLYSFLKFKKKRFRKYLSFKNTDSSLNQSLDFDKALKGDYYGQRLREMLHWEDRNSMAHSIESRNPFSDDRVLAKLALALPIENKIQEGWSKYFLRKEFLEYLPLEIANRVDKKGYSMPDVEWNKKWKEKIKESLGNEKLSKYLNTKEILHDFERLIASNDIDIHRFLFRVMSLSHFLDLQEEINEVA